MSKKIDYLNLLEESFPGLKANVIRCEAHGFPWPSKAFLHDEQEGPLLSHVGFLEYPTLVEGQLCKTAALHAVCTKKEHRGQGLASKLIQHVLQWAEGRYQAIFLFTEIPAFYERLSFRCLQEYRFHLPYHHPMGSQTLIPMVSPQHDELFRHCFQNRAPISHHFWVQDDGAIASYNALFATFPAYWSLYYSPSIDGIVSWVIENKTLYFFDVAASKMPSLDLILDHLPIAIEKIIFYFSPDRLTGSATPEPHLYDRGHLMVYGALPAIKPFMAQPLSRC